MKDEIRCSIEVREDEARLGPGRLVGTIMRYGERAADRPELFRGWLSDVAGQGGNRCQPPTPSTEPDHARPARGRR